ncbi:bifunctional riboflavin kinase/FAD synthetase [bacterium]|nr:bifunctional riboflavin kinase/FAD synthetase [Rubripirellula sp.]MDB4331648.1 bifunctional riboflavin kinase/FAD synthetase [bacterium]MDB4338564.1 bifunctional riboflavin kinase/FAD synthetase [Rubripirellula sp.]
MTEIITLAPFDTGKAAAVTSHARIGDVTLPSRNTSAVARGGVISIGNFDGVHRGHAALLKVVRTLADELSAPAIAVSLDPHPATILRPESAPDRLMQMEQRAERMSQYGIDQLLVCPVTTSFLGLSAKSFFKRLVVDQLSAKAMVEGPNFFFGKDRQGDASMLKSLCGQHEVRLVFVNPTNDANEMVSSTRIRRLISSGEISAANQLLDAPYRLRGIVIAGDQRGRTIGFPTANLSQVGMLIPRSGVYGGKVNVDGELFSAAVHIGPNPTFDAATELKIEVHLLDFDGDLYGRDLDINFLFRVRNVDRFPSVDALVEQLEKDIEFIRRRIGSN